MDRIWLESLTARGWPSPAVTIGNFDGVHRGHEALVRAAAEWARSEGGDTVVLTFDPHPVSVVDPSRAPVTLSTLDQKAELLEALGVDRLVVAPFNEDLARRPPEDFARLVLAGALQTRKVVVGDNFRFGHDRAGDVTRLADLGRTLGFEVEALAPIQHQGRPISSSRVRRVLLDGAVEEAQVLLGRPYFIDGRVVVGERRGRTLGFPTANLDSENETLPALGVYSARCRVPSGQWEPAVVNVGNRPTFGGRPVSVEAHLLDFDGDLYGAQVRLAFHARLRGEQRFAGPEALVARIREDVAQARDLFRREGV
jgi:riboflavin kinase/FMN adenylyltransferase